MGEVLNPFQPSFAEREEQGLDSRMRGNDIFLIIINNNLV